MRGEKPVSISIIAMFLGSSPHARGKGRKATKEEYENGIIPACAGKR